MRDSVLRLGVAAVVVLFLICETTELPRFRDLRGDETFYIQGAYTMMKTGDWLTPRFEYGAVRLQKPILTYWLVGAPMRIWGAGHGLWPARLPALLLALGAAVGVYGLGRVLFRDPCAALFAVAVYFSSESVYSNAHQARTDMPLAFFVVAAMYFFARLLFAPGHERRDGILAYAATGGAILVKGLAGVGLILLPVGVFLIASWKRIDRTRRRAVISVWGLGVLALIVAPWYIAVWKRYGETFTNMFLRDQIASNVQGSKWYILQSMLGYVQLISRDCGPWTIMVAVILFANLGRVRRVFREWRMEWTFLLVWAAITFLIFVCGNKTRGRYLLPVMPVFSLSVGALLARSCRSKAYPRGLFWGMRVMAVCLLLVGVVCMAQFGIGVYAGAAVQWGECVLGLVLIGGGAALIALIGRRLIREAVLCSAALAIIGLMSRTAFLLPSVPDELVAQIPREALVSTPKDAGVAMVGLSRQVRIALLLCSDCPTTKWTESRSFADRVQFLRDLLRESGPRRVLLDESVYSALPDDLRREFQVIVRRRAPDAVKFSQWLRQKSGRNLASLFHGEPVTLYVLRIGSG